MDEKERNQEPIVGKIYKLSHDGWGFISSDAIKFTRIFFHWSALNNDTLTFQDLKPGMWVKFIPVKRVEGWRAIKIAVVDTPWKKTEDT